MFFFTRNGYETEIRRLQIANSDLLEQQIKLGDSHLKQIESLVERIVALGVPEVLRELRRGPSPASPTPDSLKRPRGTRKSFYSEPRSGAVNPKSWMEPTKQDSDAVEAVIAASTEEAN